MIKHVDTVLIGKTCPASYSTIDALNAGDVALFDEKGALIATAAAAASAKELYIGVAGNKINVTNAEGSVEQKANIEMSPVIKKGLDIKVTSTAYEAPVEQAIEFDFTSATVTAGHRYVLRIVYRDIYEHPGQFTHTYEAYANSDTATDLIDQLKVAVNSHKNRRVNATVSGSKLKLTAMPKDDNDGVMSVNEYSVVEMEANIYETNPSALLGNYPEAVAGMTITKTEGTPGKGYWKQVRDQEYRNMGYKGHMFIDAYPELRQAPKVEEGAGYDILTVEYDNMYLSNDNQYIKTTPLVTELYVKQGQNLATSIVAKGIANFVAGKDLDA